MCVLCYPPCPVCHVANYNRTVHASSSSTHYSCTSVEHMLVQSGVKLSIM